MATTRPTIGVIGKLAEARLAPIPRQSGLVRPGDHLVDHSSNRLTDESGNQLIG